MSVGTRVDFLSDLEHVRVLRPARAGDSRVRVLLGNIRAEITNDLAVTFGTDRSIARLRGATESAAGWLFVAEDGLVLASDTFLGSYRRVGESHGTVWHCPTNYGALYYTDRLKQGWLATTDGLRRWPEDVVTHGVFRSAEHGAYVDFVGDLWVTNDAGRSAQRVALAGQAALGLAVRNGRIEAVTSAGTVALRDDGTTESIAEGAPVATELSTVQRWALLRAALLRWPASVWSLVEHPPHNLRRAVFAFGRDLVEVNPTSGVVLGVHPNVLPRRDCDVRVWGTRVVISCMAGDQNFVWTAQEGLRSMSLPPRRDILFSDDGLHALSNEPCVAPRYNGRSLHREATSLCVLSPESPRWSELFPPGRFMRVFELRGTRALSYLYTATDFALRITDLGSDEFETLTFDGSENNREQMASQARFAGDGTPWALIMNDRSSRSQTAFQQSFSLARWTSTSQSATPYPLPEGISHVNLQTANTGVAIGATLADLWQTSDGGAQWQKLEVAIDGSPGAIEYQLYTQNDQAVVCSSSRCLFTDLLMLEGSGPLIAPAERVLASTTPFAVTTNQQRQQQYIRMVQAPAHGLDRTRLVCTTASSLDHPKSDTIHSFDVSLSLHTAVRTPSQLAVRGTWSLDSAPGQSSSITPGEVTLYSTPVTATQGADAGWSAPYATHQWLYAQRCPVHYSQEGCDHLIFSRTAAPSRLIVDEGVRRPEDDNGELLGALAMGDGLHALLFNESASSRGCNHVILLLDDNGSLVHRRHVSCDGRELFSTTIALRDGLLGVLRLQRNSVDLTGRTFAFHPLFRGRQPVSLPPQPMPTLLAAARSALARCPRIPAPHSLVVSGQGAGLQAMATFGERYIHGHQSVVRVELSEGGEWCLRSMSGTLSPTGVWSSRAYMGRGATVADPDTLTLHSAITAGTHLVEGTIFSDTRTVQVHCSEEQ
jgi:hypothetical protein